MLRRRFHIEIIKIVEEVCPDAKNGDTVSVCLNVSLSVYISGFLGNKSVFVLVLCLISRSVIRFSILLFAPEIFAALVFFLDIGK